MHAVQLKWWIDSDAEVDSWSFFMRLVLTAIGGGHACKKNKALEYRVIIVSLLERKSNDFKKEIFYASKLVLLFYFVQIF